MQIYYTRYLSDHHVALPRKTRQDRTVSHISPSRLIYYLLNLSDARGICPGQLDTPLNDEGKEEAKHLGRLCKDLPLTSMHSSDLSRAHEVSLERQTEQRVQG